MKFQENKDNIYKAKVIICQVKFLLKYSKISKFVSLRENNGHIQGGDVVSARFFFE